MNQIISGSMVMNDFVEVKDIMTQEDWNEANDAAMYQSMLIEDGAPDEAKKHLARYNAILSKYWLPTR